jgi:hypothetical protein
MSQSYVVTGHQSNESVDASGNENSHSGTGT